MKVRDILTVIGAIALATGPALKTHGKTETLWIVGDVLTSAGAALLASRAIPSRK